MKTLIIAATLAALAMTSAAMAAPIRDPQPGDLKANANYGFDQKEGGRSAKSRLTGGDVTYVLSNRWDIQQLHQGRQRQQDQRKLSRRQLPLYAVSVGLCRRLLRQDGNV